MFARASLAILAAALLFSGSHVHAQTYSELKPSEQSVLKPLANEWDALSATRKKKWRELAARYPTLPAEEQQRITTRMEGWSRMSPEDRRAARDQFRELNSPQGSKPESREELKRKWATYRELPPEKRKELDAAAKNSRSNPQSDAVKRAGTPPLPGATIAPPGPSSATSSTPAARVEAIRPPPGSVAATR
jgi:hypothetical protein